MQIQIATLLSKQKDRSDRLRKCLIATSFLTGHNIKQLKQMTIDAENQAYFKEKR